METKECLLEPLLESAETYSKTSLKLMKLKFVDKATDFTSTLISRLILTITISFFLIVLNIAIGLWLGELLGKNYLGFLVLTLIYGVLAIILVIIHPYIKERVSNSLIKKALN